MLIVVAEACTFTADRGAGTIVVESDITSNFASAIDELQSTEARNLATGHAARQGMGDPRINGSVGSPYPINSEGRSLETVVGEHGEALPPQNPRKQICRYRVDIPVTKRLI